MKNIIKFSLYALCILLSVETMGQPTLSFKMDNPRIYRNGTKTRFQYDVFVKASALGTYFYGTQISFNLANSTNFKTVAGTDIFVDLTPLADSGFSYVVSARAWSLDKSEFKIVINPDVGNVTGSLVQDACLTMETTYKKIAIVGLEILPGGFSGTAGISFNPPGMLAGDGQQQFYALYNETIVPPLHYYSATNSFDPKDFTNTFLGRIYSNAWGWSQYSTSVAGQSLSWSTEVNTSIWDGSATITQTDNTPALATSLTIDNGAVLTVPASKQLTVTGTMTNNGTAANLVVESGGSLKQSTANVPATVRRFIGNWTAGAMKGWHLIASPVSLQPFQTSFVTNPPDATQDFYLWSEPQGLWINSKLGAGPYTFNSGAFGTNFEVGKGYLCAYATDQTKEFSGGFLNVTDQTKSVTSNGPGAWSEAGWNLLGNPFSCALQWNNGSWTLSNVDALAQIWSETNASYTVISTNGIIPALQGFMVHASAASGSVTIPAVARTHSIQTWYKSTGTPYIKLVAHNPAEQTAQESVVTFNSQATTGYDSDFDSYFQPGYAPQFYSRADTVNLAYNTLPALGSQTTVPFSFIKTGGSHYSIEAVQIDNIPTQEVYLTDLKLNQTQNLAENPVYTFTAADGDDAARFLLSFGKMVGTGEKTMNNNGIYTYQNNLYIVNPGKARLELYNLTGQKLYTEEINCPGLFKTTLYLPTAYYVVRLTTGTKVVVTKVFLKS